MFVVFTVAMWLFRQLSTLTAKLPFIKGLCTAGQDHPMIVIHASRKQLSYLTDSLIRMPKRKAAVAADVNRKKAKTGETDDHGLTVGGVDLKWGVVGSALPGGGGVEPLMVLDGDTPGRKKVAGFDIDFTLIGTKSGRKFPTGPSDWKWLYPEVPVKLKQIHDEGYRVIFFTNQAGIEKQKVKPKDIITKINAMIKTLDIPCFAFVCTGNNHYRKPSTAVWDHCVSNCNQGLDVDLSQSIYVGDAAGRAKGWSEGKSKDFSCSDRMFAINIGIGFKTPEEYFLGEKAVPFSLGIVDPQKIITKLPKTAETTYHSKNQEMVVMVGAPASGKSTFCKRFLKPHGYEIVNRDTLKTPAKCMKAAENALAAGSSVVIDNTNPAKATRQDYIDIANDAEVSCRCFQVGTTMELAQHLNLVRQNQTNGQSRRIPGVAYNMFKKHYEEPSKDEGFEEVLKIDFIPKFDNKNDEKLFMQWTTPGH